MSRQRNPVDLILGATAVLAFLGVAAAVLLQIVTRRMAGVSFVWTEELSRFLFILGIAAAAPPAFKAGDFVYIEFLIDHPANRARRFMKIAVKAITFLVFGAILYRGVFFIRLGLDQKSSAMALPMAIPYSFLVVSALCIVCSIAADFLKFVGGKVKKWK